MDKVITNSTNLCREEIEEFADSFRNDCYDIIATGAIADHEPELLLDRQKDKTSYARIFDDQDASLEYFAISYKTCSHEVVVMPIGVYGVSNSYKMRFPLYLDSFWQSFLWITKKEFAELCLLTDEQESDLCFCRLIGLRKAFIRKVFRYYFLSSGDYCSAMVWKIREKESNTRRIAEDLGFNRIERGDHEVYSSIKFAHDMIPYLDGCLSRKGLVIGGEQEGRIDKNNAQFDARLFVRCIVDHHGLKAQSAP